MKDVFISDSIVYVGVDDKNIDLFESQYVVPNGVSYNSYVILDDKITIMDTVDRRGTEGWLANLKETLGDKKPYYVVVSHLEPDHAGNLKTLLDLYPDIKVIGNPKTFTMIAQFFGCRRRRYGKSRYSHASVLYGSACSLAGSYGCL